MLRVKCFFIHVTRVNVIRVTSGDGPSLSDCAVSRT